uniref:RNA polymerase sigma-70 factor n=1 Tax=Alistipes megaguti TaxID=2364787 RepID=UPI002937015D|nr:RNA polymerase sigma-70 factor [Alistipes megaguti]
MEQIRQGDMRAYEEIFTRYYTTLCAYTRLYVRGEVSENIVQDLMLWLWENRTTLHITESLSRYLFRATRNRCLKYLNHEMVERRVLGQLSEKLHEQFEAPDFYVIEELQERIRKAVEQLPPSYREAFELNRFQHKTYEEIAGLLDISPKTVDYRIQQSLKLLRIRLKEYLPLIAVLLWHN